MQQDFGSSFRRLEVVGLKCTRQGEDEDAEDVSSGGNRRRSVDVFDDTDQRVCGTAEALQQIRHLITTDFIVLSCDLIGHVDFFALASEASRISNMDYRLSPFAHDVFDTREHFRLRCPLHMYSLWRDKPTFKYHTHTHTISVPLES